MHGFSGYLLKMRIYNFQVIFLFQILISFNKMSSKEVTDHTFGFVQLFHEDALQVSKAFN